MAGKHQPQSKLTYISSFVSSIEDIPLPLLQHPLPEVEYVRTIWGLGFITRPGKGTSESREIRHYKAQGNTICVTCLEDGVVGYFAPASLSLVSAAEVTAWKIRYVQSHLLAVLDTVVARLALSA